jgi:hypothetical protein
LPLKNILCVEGALPAKPKKNVEGNLKFLLTDKQLLKKSLYIKILTLFLMKTEVSEWQIFAAQ